MMRLSNSRCGIKLAAHGRGVTDGYCARARSLREAACRSFNSIMLICSSTVLHGSRKGSARKPANKTMDMNPSWSELDNCRGPHTHTRLSSLCGGFSGTVASLQVHLVVSGAFQLVYWNKAVYSLNTCKARTKEHSRRDGRSPEVTSANLD